MTRLSLSALASAQVFLLTACGSPTLPEPDEVVAAERAFAKDGYDLGFKASFLKHSAADAIVLQPGPVNAHESLNAAPDLAPGEIEPKLVWWPLYAGIAGSGDLGFTTGPYAVDDERRGHYFTVWKKQADGQWKWVIDAGVGADPAAEAEQGADVSFLPTARTRSASPHDALAAVVALERRLAERAADDVSAAYGDVLDEDSRLHSSGPPPAKTPDRRDAVFMARPASITFSHLGGGASDAGDLVWTYGEGRWSENGAGKTGHYIRVWQKRRAGWRLVFDELVPPPSPPPEG